VIATAARGRLPARGCESGNFERVSWNDQRSAFLACPSNVLRFSREGADGLPDEPTDVAAPSPAASAC
jgi:hypothetical protein